MNVCCVTCPSLGHRTQEPSALSSTVVEEIPSAQWRKKALEDAQILSAKTGPSFEGRDHSVSSSWLNCCFLQRNKYFEEGWGIHSPCRGAGLLGGPYSD